MVGEEALRAGLEAQGFVTVRLEERSWAEQIALFRAARVVELFARDYVNPGYWRVAALGGLDYRPVLAAGPDAPREERTANGTDIAVGGGSVLAALTG